MIPSQSYDASMSRAWVSGEYCYGQAPWTRVSRHHASAGHIHLRQPCRCSKTVPFIEEVRIHVITILLKRSPENGDAMLADSMMFGCELGGGHHGTDLHGSTLRRCPISSHLVLCVLRRI
jgi:hypothetical protein